MSARAKAPKVMGWRKYIVGYEIVGHVLIEASNPQAAAAEAYGYVTRAAQSIPGDQERRVPYGPVIEATPCRRKP